MLHILYLVATYMYGGLLENIYYLYMYGRVS